MPAFITPIRMDVSKAFPLASFNVHTGTGPSWFEVVLTTDPELLRPDRKAARTSSNFFSTRAGGPLPAERGDAVYIVPPGVLSRFVGQPKLYYALAVYARPDFRNPEIVPIRSDARAYLRVSQSYTGDVRGLTGVPSASGGLAGVSGYGTSAQGALTWGGDEAATPVAAPQPAMVGVATAPSLVGASNGSASNGSASNGGTSGQAGVGFAYDDGYDATLWSSASAAPVPAYQAGDPYADSFAIVQPVYAPSNFRDAIAFYIEWLGRGARWSAGVADTTIIPHSAICQLRVSVPGGTGIGTGFYIARDRILTCAHNVQNATSIRVIPGKNGSAEPYGAFTVSPSQWYQHPQYVHGGDGDFDLAVIKVDTPPPNGWHFDMLEELNESRPSPVIVCGYAARTVDRDKQHLDGDAVLGLSDNMERLQYNIQTEPGNSGSPVFYVWGYEDHERMQSVQDIRIIAVHISGFDHQLNQGCRLTEAKIDWIWNAERRASSQGLGTDVGNGRPTNGHATNGYATAGRAAVAARPMRAFGMSAGVHYDVHLIAQPDKLSCWAASMAMLVSYRRQQSISPESLAQEVGRSLRTSYDWDMLRAVRDHFRFETIQLPSNASLYPSPEQWYRWLSDHGPLWVTTVGNPSHAIIVAGISGDLTPDGSTIEILNPWNIDVRFDGDPVDFNPPNYGKKYSQSFNDFAADFGNLGLGDYGSWRVLYLPASATSQGLGYRASAMELAPVEPDNVERMRQTFVNNVSANNRKDCITIMNAGLRAFYGSRLQDAAGRDLPLSNAVHSTMAKLEEYGLAFSPTVFEFNNAQGRLTYGVTRPDRLRASVESWLFDQIGDPQHSAWYLFGLSIMDGYHSVTLAVAYSGRNEPLTRIYWADQHNQGWTDTTGQIDARITSLTQTWWDGAQPKPRTRVTLWPLKPASTPVSPFALSVTSEEDGIETAENEESVAFGLARGLDDSDSVANCEAFCPVSAADEASSAHFAMSEFNSRDGVQVPRGFRGNVQRVMENLEVLRTELGDKPMTIVSGFRSCEHNRRVGGASRSRHLCGQAADIRVADTTPETVHATIERLIGEGRMQQGGLGIYNTFVHYDTRGTRARWDNRRSTGQSVRTLNVDEEPRVTDGGDAHGDPDLAGAFGAGAGASALTRPWRVAGCLLTLRTQVNTRWPGRNKASDGTIGDAAHASRSSDHNPWVVDGAEGVVTAMDITHDPTSGCTGDVIADAIIAARDARVKYIIWNRQILSSYAINGVDAWCWRPYGGSNPHTHHIHISVSSDKALYDDTTQWSI